jgi:ankyrin repeat protein
LVLQHRPPTLLRGGRASLISAAVKCGARLDGLNKNCETPLLVVAGSGRPDALEAILDELDDMGINVTDAKGWTALGFNETAAILSGEAALEGDDVRAAVASGQTALVRQYLERGGECELADERGYTLLLRAVDGNQPEMVSLLLDHSAKIDAVSDDNFTALMLCINRVHNKGPRIGAFEGEYRDHVRVAEILISRGIALTVAKTDTAQKALRDAAEASEHITKLIVDRLVADGRECKKELDHRDTEGFTTLHLAARRGCLSSIKALCEAGADVNVPVSYGFIPLHEAIIAGKTEAVKYLLQCGADAAHMISRGYGVYAEGDDAKAIAEKSRSTETSPPRASG